MSNGTVKWFNTKKGYGFIIPEEKSVEKDIFVHITRLEKTGIKKLLDGQHVSFDLYDDNGKPAAENVFIMN
ncbi:MAG: cold-shock protein [Alphaproteobacteria bacterium]